MWIIVRYTQLNGFMKHPWSIPDFLQMRTNSDSIMQGWSGTNLVSNSEHTLKPLRWILDSEIHISKPTFFSLEIMKQKICVLLSGVKFIFQWRAVNHHEIMSPGALVWVSDITRGCQRRLLLICRLLLGYSHSVLRFNCFLDLKRQCEVDLCKWAFALLLEVQNNILPSAWRVSLYFLARSAADMTFESLDADNM